MAKRKGLSPEDKEWKALERIVHGYACSRTTCKRARAAIIRSFRHTRDPEGWLKMKGLINDRS